MLWRLTACVICFVSGLALADDWRAVRTIDGVAVEFRPTESGYHVHRAETAVCADLDSLEVFVGDTSRFKDWIPYTRHAELLEQSEAGYVYYVRSMSPWPLKDRDMVYRITRMEGDSQDLKLAVTGLPDYQPPRENTERIQEAAGEWHLVPFERGIRVRYQLYVHPGTGPAYFVNRRLAAAVGKTLANLAAEFPCGSA